MDISYQDKQNALFEAVEALARRGEDLNPVLAPPEGFAADDRICLTAVTFLPPRLRETIDQLAIRPLLAADPRQYYYPPASLHLTIQNVRVIHQPPNFSAADIATARDVFRRVVPKHAAFAFELVGLLQLPASLALRAYSPENLHHLVSELRRELAQAGIPDDKAYGSPDVFFGNVTIVRYNQQPNPSFFAQLDTLKHSRFGRLPIDTVTLITTNIACHPRKTKHIETFHLALD